jgi:DNA polymerase I-like protein with 3'-5' exonuclease and polymerase domains
MPVIEGIQLTLVNNADACGDLMRWLSGRDVIGLDVESTGLDPLRDRVRLVQVGDGQHGWAIPFERWGGLFEELASRYRGTYVCHSAFDWKMLKKEGIVIDTRRIRDTRVQAHVLSSTGPLALKPLCDVHVDPRCSAGQQILEDAMKRAGWTWETVPPDFEPYWTYGALDPCLAWHLDRKLWPRVQLDAPFSYDLEVATQWVTDKMELYGARIDRDYCVRHTSRLYAYMRDATEWVRGTYGVLPGANDQLVQIFLQLGFPLFKKTQRGGKLALDKHVLASIDHPLATTILNYRRARTISGTYLQNYLTMADASDLIHPRINTIGGTSKNPYEPGGGKGVRTTRMSMDTPNLQNVPVRGYMTQLVRNAFVARPGNTWVKVDADQIEMRILTHLCEDPGLISAFKSPGDFFVNLAVSIFDEPNFRKDDTRRQWVKNGGYAKIYGAGIPQLARTIGISEDVAGAFMRRFDEIYPGAQRFNAWLINDAKRRLEQGDEAFTRSPLTNRKHVADRGREYALVNYLIQGTAAEVLKMKIVEADQAGLADYMVFPVHDELDADVPVNVKDDYVTTLRDVVNDENLLKVPLTWSVATGPRWGECT